MRKFLDIPPTPGPWHVGAGLMVCAEDGSPVARCSSTRGKYEFEEPNAYLIAGAPELLRAARAALDQIGAGPEGQWAYALLRRAIRLAEGGAA